MVTPGRTITTVAGTGSVGYRGDGSVALAATLARPSGVVYDDSGNLYLADANNHVVRKVSAAGLVTTVAGAGIAGFGGDGGQATAAYLDTPTSVAVNAKGDLYIADSHNHRIREVSDGKISTIAGTGTSGFSGDRGPATAAQLALPSGVAADSSGNLYIADTNNHRIRKVAAGTITTIAGDGEELFAGDGGPATAASLDEPTAVAIDVSGSLYVSDKNNQRVRVVSTTGTISTLAGSGAPSFAGGFSGDADRAVVASLARPVSISVDSSGTVYVADTNNQRIRQISASGEISTLAGTGDQGFGGDGGPATGVLLNSPGGLTTDGGGNLLVADTGNQRLRAASQGKITFAAVPVGTTSSPQLVTLSNTGTSSLTVSLVKLSGAFGIVPGGTCPAVPIVLAARASCTENIAYQPTGATTASGSVAFGGLGLDTQTVLLSGGQANQSPTVLTLTESKPASLSGELVTFTATVKAPGAPGSQPSGSITFYDGATVLGTAGVVDGTATLSTGLPDGAQTVTATYAGSSGYAGASSAALTETVADYTLALSVSGTATVEPGHSIAVPVLLNAADVDGLTANLTLAVTNLPGGLSVQFSPATTPLKNGQLLFTMNVAAAPVAASHMIRGFGAGGAVLASLGLPFFGTRRRGTAHIPRHFLLLLLILGNGALLTSLTGCAQGNGFFGQPQKSYVLPVTATATDSTGGTLARSTPLTMFVQ